MDLHLLVDISAIFGSIALVVSVLLLALELRESNRLIKAANTQALVSLSTPFNMGLIQDRKMAEFYVHGARQFASMDEIDRYRYKSLLIWWLIFHENIYYQWRQGLLDKHTFKPWTKDLKVFIVQQDLGVHWGLMHNLFQDEFSNFVAQLIAECKQEDEPPSRF